MASLGALLALIAGMGRTSLAMARHHDLPTWLAAIHPRYQVPHHAETALAVLVRVLVLTSDPRSVIGFSSFGVPVYYAIANISVASQPPQQRRWPRPLNGLGLVGRATLAATLPLTSMLTRPATTHTPTTRNRKLRTVSRAGQRAKPARRSSIRESGP
jgi:APA family basic amino acid/polyamine antiporter